MAAGETKIRLKTCDSATTVLPVQFWKGQFYFSLSLSESLKTVFQMYIDDQLTNQLSMLRTVPNWNKIDPTLLAMQQTILRSPAISKPIWLFRGMNFESKTALENHIHHFRTHQIYDLRGFQSFSYSLNNASGFLGKWSVMWVVRAPANTHGLWMTPFTKGLDENELLLPHGTKVRFRGFTDEIKSHDPLPYVKGLTRSVFGELSKKRNKTITTLSIHTPSKREKLVIMVFDIVPASDYDIRFLQTDHLNLTHPSFLNRPLVPRRSYNRSQKRPSRIRKINKSY